MEKQQQNATNQRAYVYSDFLRRNNYIRGLSHNLYSGYLAGKHKIHAAHNDSLTPWSDERIKATLDSERWHNLAESICEFMIFALFGAMLVLAYLT